MIGSARLESKSEILVSMFYQFGAKKETDK